VTRIGFLALALALAIAAGLAGGAAGAEPVTSTVAGARVDWTAGTLTAEGVAVAGLRAPSVAVARVAAERRARDRAAAALARAARALPLADGGTVGAAVDAAPTRAGAIDAAIAAAAATIAYGSDGSSRATLAAPLEAVRAGLDAPRVGVDPADAPTALVVELRGKLVRPALGLALAAGAERYAGPTVWHRDVADAAADPRAGARVVRLVAHAVRDGVVDLGPEPAATLAAARAGGALVVVALGKGGKAR
jgi:hypothetical protein